MRLVACEKCQVENLLNGKFCRQCGEPLSDLLIQQARDENARLVGDGQKLLGEGRVDEALMIARAALESDPDCLSALALQGDAYEKLGRYDQALEAYEAIVQLRPDSPLDRIRVAHLRKLTVSQELEIVEPQNRRNAIYASLAAGVLLLAAGSALYLATTPQVDPSKLTAQRTEDERDGLEPFKTLAPVPTSPSAGTATERPGDGATTTQPTTDGRSLPNAGTDATRRGYFPTGGSTRVNSNGPGLPGPGQAGPTDQGYQPFDPGTPTFERDPGDNTNTGGTTGSGGNSTPPTQNGNGNQEPPKTGDPDPTGIIDIRPSNGSKGNGGAEPVREDARTAENLIRVARDAYATGNFSKAADAYEKALRAGASQGSTNQRLAQCYEKMGRKQDAIGAYQRAIQAYEAKINSGKGTPRDQSAVDACRQAIRLLGG